MKRISSVSIVLFILGLWAVILLPQKVNAESPIWAPSSLEILIEEGLTQNKVIQSLKASVEGLEEKVPFAGSLDDPKLGLALINVPTDTFNFDQEAMTKKEISISQKLPWFGKLDLRSQRVTLEALRQKEVLRAKQFELSRQIAVAYYEMGFVVKSLEINKRLSDTVNQILHVAETKYATGKGLQQDVLQAQVELSKLIDEKILLKKKKRTLEDRINELINRESFLIVKPPAGLEFMDLQLVIEELQSQALETNPQLQIRKADIEIANTDVELARKDYWPDMDFRVAYGQRDEDRTGRNLPDLVSASVVMNIPLWQAKRQDPKLASTKKSKEAATKTYRSLAESLPHQVDALATEIRDTQESYKLFTDALLLQADQWANSSLLAYEVGSVNFNTMIGAQIRLLRFELKANKYLFDTYQKRAELEEILGRPLS